MSVNIPWWLVPSSPTRPARSTARTTAGRSGRRRGPSGRTPAGGTSSRSRPRAGARPSPTRWPARPGWRWAGADHGHDVLNVPLRREPSTRPSTTPGVQPVVLAVDPGRPGCRRGRHEPPGSVTTQRQIPEPRGPPARRTRAGAPLPAQTALARTTRSRSITRAIQAWSVPPHASEESHRPRPDAPRGLDDRRLRPRSSAQGIHPAEACDGWSVADQRSVRQAARSRAHPRISARHRRDHCKRRAS